MTTLDYILARIHFGEGEEGQTMAEYAVVLAVITVAIVVTLGLLGTGISGALSKVTNSL